MKMMMFAPGDTIALSKNWRFRLFFDNRNSKLLQRFMVDGSKVLSYGTSNYSYSPRSQADFNNIVEYHSDHIVVELPRDTELIFDCTYLKKNAPGYNSVTFKTPKGKDMFSSVSFWAKLSDVNTIEFV